MRTIQIPAGVYQLSRLGAEEDLNDTGDLDVFVLAQFIGDPNGGTIIDGMEADRILHFQYEEFYDEQFVIQDLTLQNGAVVGNGGGVKAAGIGGGVVILNSILRNNRATGWGGGVYYVSAGGTFHVENTAVLENWVGESGGGLWYFGLMLTLDDAEISGNVAGQDGGGIGGRSAYEEEAAAGSGGEILTGILGIEEYPGFQVQGGLIERNMAGRDGGGIWYNGGELQIDQGTIQFNEAGRNGGGVALYGTYQEGETVRVVDTHVDKNIAGQDGGGLYVLAVPGTLLSSAIGNNIAMNGNGGGVYYGKDEEGGVLGGIAFKNTTLSGNEAGQAGGGAWVMGGSTTFIHNTVVNNKAGPDGAGGICNRSGEGAVELKANIIANNGGRSDCSGLEDFDSQGHNLVSDSTCVNGAIKGDILGLDPALGDLAENGGHTPTHTLRPESPAINAADPDNTLETDQRGEARDALPDIGAFEVTTGDNTIGGGACALNPSGNPSGTMAFSFDIDFESSEDGQGTCSGSMIVDGSVCTVSADCSTCTF